jgi:hypothetical protein
MGFGLGITSAIEIQNLSHIVPTFLFLSAVQAITAHVSTKIVDEIHLNNVRANLLFNDYFSKEKCPRRTFASCQDINALENFYLPNFISYQRENFIKYGNFELNSVLAKNEGILSQL